MRELEPRAEPLVRDALEFASPFFRAFYASSYNRVASRAPRMWGFVYRRSERQPYQGIGPRIRMAVNAWNCRGFGDAARRLGADAILCTQFLPAEVFAGLRERGRLDIPVYCAITDFSIHPIWVYRGMDRYFVATESVREELEDTGQVEAERIEVSGVPIDPRFAVSIGGAAARTELGLDPDPARPTLLLMGGGFGWGPMEGMLEIVLGLPDRVQAVVVAGRNQRLRERLAVMAKGQERRIQIHGFTDRVDLLLEASDLLVGKAGGLTSSESMARGVPMVVFRPIPGQEERNCDYLQESGAAVRAHDLDELHYRLRHFLANPEHLGRMRSAAARIGRPRSAYQVAESVLRRLTPLVPGAKMR
jgi:processive 1,2-diacylglycerol beta-glucosyltransferase